MQLYWKIQLQVSKDPYSGETIKMGHAEHMELYKFRSTNTNFEGGIYSAICENLQLI